MRKPFLQNIQLILIVRTKNVAEGKYTLDIYCLHREKKINYYIYIQQNYRV